MIHAVKGVSPNKSCPGQLRVTEYQTVIFSINSNEMFHAELSRARRLAPIKIYRTQQRRINTNRVQNKFCYVLHCGIKDHGMHNSSASFIYALTPFPPWGLYRPKSKNVISKTGNRWIWVFIQDALFLFNALCVIIIPKTMYAESVFQLKRTSVWNIKYVTSRINPYNMCAIYVLRSNQPICWVYI